MTEFRRTKMNFRIKLEVRIADKTRLHQREYFFLFFTTEATILQVSQEEKKSQKTGEGKRPLYQTSERNTVL